MIPPAQGVRQQSLLLAMASDEDRQRAGSRAIQAPEQAPGHTGAAHLALDAAVARVKSDSIVPEQLALGGVWQLPC
jgi:hypothetical protein